METVFPHLDGGRWGPLLEPHLGVGHAGEDQVPLEPRWAEPEM